MFSHTWVWDVYYNKPLFQIYDLLKSKCFPYDIPTDLKMVQLDDVVFHWSVPSDSRSVLGEGAEEEKNIFEV